MALPTTLQKSLTATASIAVAELFSEGKSAANDPDEFPFAEISERLDGRTCPLCQAVDGMIVQVGSPEYKQWRQPSHINCRRVMAYISKDEAGVEADFEAPDADLIRKHGHYHVDPDKYAEFRVPAEPSGRHFVVRRVKNPETGEVRTVLDWAPWHDQLPAAKRELVLKARGTTDEGELTELLEKLGITDPLDPVQLRQATLLGLRDRLEGWQTLRINASASKEAATTARLSLEALAEEFRAQKEELEHQITDRRTRMMAAYKAGRPELGVSYSSQLDQAAQALQELKSTVAAQVVEVLHADRATQFRIEYGEDVPPHFQERWDPIFRLFGRLVENGRLEDQTLQVKWVAGETRGEYQGSPQGVTPRIHLGAQVPDRNVIHELGHWLEDLDPEVLDAAVKFYLRRTQNGQEPLKKLKVFGDYGDDEETRVDRFVHPYMGKDPYRDAQGKAYATEVVSEALAYLYSEPLEFFKDADHFEFLFDVLRGR